MTVSIEFSEKVHGKRFIVKETARVADGMLGAVRGACIQFGDLDNYKDKMEFENQMVANYVASMTPEQRLKLLSEYCSNCGESNKNCSCSGK